MPIIVSRATNAVIASEPQSKTVMDQLWEALVKETIKRHPELLKPERGDTTGNDAG